MTNEEAIRHLQTYSTTNGSGQTTQAEHEEAKQTAIKALSQQTEDAISRQAVLDLQYRIDDSATLSTRDVVNVEDIEDLPSVNPQEPSDISNDGTLTVNVDDGRKISRVLVCGANHWGGLYYPDDQEPKTGQFAKWLASEIFDDNREYNKDSFDELACRKLAKLGIVRANGDKWELVVPQESEVEQ